MAAADIFAEPDALEADLFLLESILWSRNAVPERLVAASVSQDPEVIDLLRIESMYQFAEFFFLLQARGIEQAEDIGRLADVHNLHVSTLSSDAGKMRRLGLRKERLLDAIFTADTLPRLLQNWHEAPGSIDQSNLARFLATVMSTETCRKLAVAASEAGFLARSKSPHGTVLLRSTGVMEQVFGRVVRDLRGRIRDGQA